MHAESEVVGNGLVQSVDRALTILELLAVGGELGVTEMAKTLDVHKSTVSRLVATLEEHGLVEQISDRGQYRLALGIVRLAGAARGRLDIVTECRQISRGLAARTGETVNVAILTDLETLYLDQVSSPSAVQIQNWLGKRNPVYATANGRVLLAWLPPTEIDQVIDRLVESNGAFERHTEQTVTDPGVLRGILASVRDRGYDVAVDELELGLTAIAAPIRGDAGTVIASLSVSGPSFRLNPDRLAEAIPALLAAAAEVSTRMGHHAFMSTD
ncbi:IclR family transcriptional regulator [Cryobacterium psychrophilum]|uniref:Glycerol operon regulatory protein n=2 Tax=Cryobacterium psychrophilum TaxID=41988 RepID=A0A4Y8KXB0_9MICO|nr:IclR family transcriptional regulator [Cryobacterium psychrophilum]